MFVDCIQTRAFFDGDGVLSHAGNVPQNTEKQDTDSHDCMVTDVRGSASVSAEAERFAAFGFGRIHWE
jgi:hypothetical protein